MFEIIRRPIISEKSTALAEVAGKYAFEVLATANKNEVKDAVEKLLKETQKAKKANGKVITVIGCGGDRDREKRPKMASVAVEYSDKVILTADNPRSEDPRDIIADMKEGLDKTELKKILVVIDRKEAINTACHLANKEDIIVIAGKGHEKYQEINGSRFPFDDMAVLRDIFSEFNL
jgi:UDP-N-acetylmuramoyl-L-alanyl-D-glutamate--2,6-diaminopimelate ligase